MSYVETIKWNLVKLRATKEENKHHKETYGIELRKVFNGRMPSAGKEILIQTDYGISCALNLYDDGHYYLDSGRDWADVIAWAEMPKGIDWSEDD